MELNEGHLLYKFLPFEYALLALRGKKLKASFIHEFNDPYDGKGLIHGPNSGYRVHGVKSEGQKVIENFVLLCLSERYDHPAMWAHYADSCKGIALELRYDGVSGYAKPWKVNYDNLKPIQLINDSHASVEMHDKLPRTKAKFWEYENEVRFTAGARNGSPVSMDEGKYFIDLPKIGLSITKVIVGNKFDYGDLERLKCTLKNIPGAELYKATPKEYEFMFDIGPIA